jgi:hypothetical protein
METLFGKVDLDEAPQQETGPRRTHVSFWLDVSIKAGDPAFS